MKLPADQRIDAFQIVVEIFRNNRIGLRIVHHDKMSRFASGEFVHGVEQPQIVCRAVVEGVERMSRLEHFSGGIFIAALRVEQSQSVSGRGPPGGSIDSDFVHRGRARILPHPRELLGDFEIRL